MDQSPAEKPPESPRVQISKDETAPLADILALVDRNCRHCAGTGLVRFAAAPGETPKPMVCGCGVVRYRRRMARARSAGAIGVALAAAAVANVGTMSPNSGTGRPTFTPDCRDPKRLRRIQIIEREIARECSSSRTDGGGRLEKLRRRLEFLSAW